MFHSDFTCNFSGSVWGSVWYPLWLLHTVNESTSGKSSSKLKIRSVGAVSDLFKAGDHHFSGEPRLVSYQSVTSKYTEGTCVHLCMVKSHLSSPNQAFIYLLQCHVYL